jgi:outer membrane protein assembly factor BamD (BamD/ComL family)
LLDAGFYAFTKKDYISALKYYNTIIVKYPGSSELQLAYLAKSKMYNEMGLIDQAKLNLQYANQVGKKAQTTK